MPKYQEFVRPRISKRKLRKRMLDYAERTKKFSPLNQLEYNFLKGLYQYLTKQYQTPEQKKELYNNYTLLIDKGYSFNRETPDPDILEIIYLQLKLILENEYKGPLTFITLNNNWHYERMNHIIDLIYTWSLSPGYYGYASENEFFDLVDFMRKEFNNNRVDITKAVGKYPRKLRKRFNRLNIKKE